MCDLRQSDARAVQRPTWRLPACSLLSLALVAATAGAASLAEVRARGQLRVAASLSGNESFFSQTEEGSYRGLEWDIVSSFARTLGVGVEVVHVGSFGELFSAIEGGTADLAAGGITITEERSRRFDFSTPYFKVVVSAVTRADRRVESIEDLEGKVGQASPGTVFEEQMKRIPGVRVFHDPSRTDNYGLVEDGTVDFLFDDSPGVLTSLPDHPDLEVAFNLPGVDGYGLMLPKGSDLLAPLNEYLSRVTKGSTYYQLVWRHLGDLGVELLDLPGEHR